MAIVIFRSFFAADWAATLIPFVVCNINYDNFFRRNSFDTDIFYDNAIDTDEFFLYTCNKHIGHLCFLFCGYYIITDPIWFFIVFFDKSKLVYPLIVMKSPFFRQSNLSFDQLVEFTISAEYNRLNKQRRIYFESQL